MPASGIERTLRTLLRTENPRAVGLLAAALESDEAPLRCGAVRALAMRGDSASGRALVEKFHRLPADARAALKNVDHNAPFAGTLLKFIRPTTPRLARRAIGVAVEWGLSDALPLTVEAATWPDCPYAGEFAAEALRLASDVEQQMQAYDPHVDRDEASRPADPAFVRRASVNALTKALSRFAEHGHQTLVDALLLLTPSDEPALHESLRDEDHPAHAAVLESLRTSPCHGVLGVLAGALSDLRSPDSLLQIAAQRGDPEGLEQILSQVGSPVGLRVRENCHRVSCFAWVGPERCDVLLNLSGKAQAAAAQMAAASSCDPRDVVATLNAIIEWGDAPGPLMACRAIRLLPEGMATEPLGLALMVSDPAVIAAATQQLRQKGFPDATSVLVQLLNHGSSEVQRAAGRSLRELSYPKFRDIAPGLSVSDQRTVGQLVGKADPLAVPSLRSELHAGPVSRRLLALEMIDLMNLVDDLAIDIAEQLLRDNDIGVRVEATQLLGRATPSDTVLKALVQVAGNSDGSVKSAAQSSLAMFGELGQLKVEEADV